MILIQIFICENQKEVVRKICLYPRSWSRALQSTDPSDLERFPAIDQLLRAVLSRYHDRRVTALVTRVATF